MIKICILQHEYQIEKKIAFVSDIKYGHSSPNLSFISAATSAE